MQLGMLFWGKTPEDLKGWGIRQRTRKYIKEHGSGCGAQWTLTSQSRTQVIPVDYIQHSCRFRLKLRFKDLAMGEADLVICKDNLSNTARNVLTSTVLLVSFSPLYRLRVLCYIPRHSSRRPHFPSVCTWYCLLLYFLSYILLESIIIQYTLNSLNSTVTQSHTHTYVFCYI